MQTATTIRIRHEGALEPCADVVHASTGAGGNILSLATHRIGRTHIYRDSVGGIGVLRGGSHHPSRQVLPHSGSETHP